MDVSIVIVNYNVREYIISCIESIYKHSNSNISFEIVVVDNDSNDDSLIALKKVNPKIKIIENNFNFGFSVAVNQGVKICKGEYIFLLNPDTLFIDDVLSKLIKLTNKLPNFGVIGPKLVSKKGEYQQSFWREPTLISTLLSIAHLDSFNFKKNYTNVKFDNIIQVDTVSGGGMFLKKEVFNHVNGLDENLFWMEDIDLCIRLKRRGYLTYYFTETEIVHFIGKSAKTNYKTSISNQLLSKIKFFNKHHSRWSAKIIFFSILFILLIKMPLFLFFSLFHSTYRKKFVAYLYTLRLVINFSFSD